MVKALRAFRRAPGMGRDEFLRRWDEHARLVLAVPGVRGYVQSPRVGRDDQSSAPFDGYSALYFDDEDAFAQARLTPEAQAVRADFGTFTDIEGVRAALTREVVLRDVPVAPEAVKLAFFFARRVGLSPEVFRQHWRDKHGRLVLEYIETLRRYVQNQVLESVYSRGEPDFDGVAEAYLDDLAALDAIEQSPEHDLVRSDEPNFVDVNRIMHLAAAERVHLAPAALGSSS